MPEYDAPTGWEYVATVDVNDLCDDVYGSDNPVTEKLEELGADPSGPAVTCAAVAVAGGTASYFGGPVTVVGGATVIGGICAVGGAGCAAEGIFSKQTGCNGVEFEVWTMYEVHPRVMIVPVCDGDLFDEDLVDDLEDVADDAWNTADDIADQLSEGLGSLIEEGWDVIGV